jgi:urea carboxylase
VLAGRAALRIEETVFNLGEYTRFLEAQSDSIAAFRRTQRDAFTAEREQWKIDGTDKIPDAPEAAPSEDIVLPEGCEGVAAPLAGNILRVLVNEGDVVTAGQTVAVLESMKMEFPAAAPAAGVVRAVKCNPGSVAHAGQWLAVIERNV